MSKALASQEVLDACHHKGLTACIVHPSGIMGPGDYAVGEMTGNLVRIINGELSVGIDVLIDGGASTGKKFKEKK